ncbi:stage V sporulation protein AD [Coprococcus eutactus]|jgi:stage V sporulation protein AD|uniref:stage V sporulation protein AD n=1 Tax=Coprococcus eutactus TaxID=33043 RepID=UPI00015E9E7E|nr:stage V sporulation protein AD [Coprococcus eutactus]EDP24985.1 stage V sporulation protein AD [Coprococcus eutactus ATCC 27759]UEA80181.1 stage V sporulation protein AD [Coprococcus eutactus ATCC 27759]UWP17943.1 stage V sporulation protein AD [Coprococcus eutactus]
MKEKVGKQSLKFENAPYIIGAASVAGPKEIDGPMARYFDRVSEDPTFGKDSWEEGESEMVRQAVMLAIQKAGVNKDDIRYVFAGDLLGQLIASTFGIKDMEIPVFGLYGACSTCGEALSLAAMTVAAGYADNVVAEASSHYGSAEKQFRFPLEYGNQRPLSATWTVTGSGAFVVSDRESEVCIKGITTGRIVDYGVKDSLNMGACMAPAAADVIYQNLQDFDIEPTYYDRIITGDLGKVGKKILTDLLKMNQVDISDNHMDCGIEIFDNEEQDTHSGGSGCGCSATVLAGYILKKVSSGEWKRVLFVPTGALLSTVSFNEGQTIPGVAHAVVIEHHEMSKGK